MPYFRSLHNPVKDFPTGMNLQNSSCTEGITAYFRLDDWRPWHGAESCTRRHDGGTWGGQSGISLDSRQTGGSDGSQLRGNQKWVLVQAVNCSLYVVQSLAGKVGIAVFQ